jgi:uncharacterized protein (DUF433 family)
MSSSTTKQSVAFRFDPIAVRRTRLDVADVLEMIRQNGNSVEDAAEYLEIPVEHVEDCVGYYADYKDEIDAWVQRSREIARRGQERWDAQPDARGERRSRRNDL